MHEPTDYGTFERAFRRLSGAFRLKLKPAEFEELSHTYFRVLDAYPIDEVMRAGKACLAKCKTFPKVADWLAEVASATAQRAPADCRWMTPEEMDDLAQAAARRYEDAACGCLACQYADVTDRPLRFVPTLEGDAYARAFNSHRNVVELVGHWAHGEELGRWYAARAAFYAAVPARLVRVVQLLAREPGEDG